ncbi:MAG: sodium ABC transporter ATP-binding protein [Planctomycetes bacterium]|nr:sodium ABC transporter ATP-binding protein [Planctomycetota bacterium]
MNDNAIEIQGLGKRFGDFALKDVSFSLPRGYVMGLIGPNGAGKTTIAKLVMNLIRRDTGTIRVFGKDNVAAEVEVRARIGFVYDEPCFYDDANLEQHARAIAPLYPGWKQSRCERLADRFGVPPRKKFKALSHGMKRKLALVLALSHDADLLILDEPTSGLDPLFRRDLLDCLADVLQDEGKSVLFSTHIVSDLERVADYVTFLNQGQILFSLDKEELAENWAIIKGDESVVAAVEECDRRGIRKSRYGVEVLTCNVGSARKLLGADAVVERASLEDIMVLMTQQEDRHAA